MKISQVQLDFWHGVVLKESLFFGGSRRSLDGVPSMGIFRSAVSRRGPSLLDLNAI